MPSYDVAVIGAGLAGLQAARLLGKRGLKVLLVDRKASVESPVYTTGIFVRKTLEDFDLPEDCLGRAVRHVTLYSPGGRRIPLESPHPEFRVGRIGKLYRRFLAEAVEAGVEWLPSTHYLKAEPEGDGVRLYLGVRERPLSVRARYLVGADGARSRVAQDLGLSQNREFIVGLEDVYEGVPLDGPAIFHCFLDPLLAPGYLAWVIHDGEEVHLGVGGYVHRFDPARAMEVFRERVRSLVDLSRARLLERRGGRIPVGGVLPRIAGRHGLLVGDASGAVSPLTAGGLDPCMRLSALAARLIPEYLASGDPAALALYSGERFRARFISRLWMRRLLSSLRHPLLVEPAFAAMQVWPFRRVAEQVFFGRGSFPDVEELAVPRRNYTLV